MTQSSEDIVSVLEAHRFNVSALATYLIGRVDDIDAGLEVSQFQGGQSNPTFLLACNGREWVLRKKPPGKLLPSAHAVDREHRIQAALQDSDVPVARMHHYCDDETVIGTPFYVMDRMVGRVFHENHLPGLMPGERSALYDAMNDVLARLHAVDWKALGLDGFGRPGNYFARQINRWSKQWASSKLKDVPAMDRLMEWLPEHIPEDDTTTIVHGDYRLGNLMFHPTEPRVTAVFDWELSTLGHPLADLGFNCMPYNLAPEVFSGIEGFNLAELGIPDQESYVRRYCARTGREDIDTRFFLAFSMFRMAAIVEGVAARGFAGNASSESAKSMAAYTRPYAERAWKIAQA